MEVRFFPGEPFKNINYLGVRQAGSIPVISTKSVLATSIFLMGISGRVKLWYMLRRKIEGSIPLTSTKLRNSFEKFRGYSFVIDF